MAHDLGGGAVEDRGGVVARAPVRGDLPQDRDGGVFGEEPARGDPLGALLARALLGERGAVEAGFRRAHEQIPQFVPEGPHRQHLRGDLRGPTRAHAIGEVTGDEFGEDLILLRTGDERGGGFTPAARTLAQEPEGERGGGAHEQLPRGAPEFVGDDVLQGGGALPGGGEEHGAARAVGAHVIDEGVHREGRLSRLRRADDEVVRTPRGPGGLGWVGERFYSHVPISARATDVTGTPNRWVRSRPCGSTVGPSPGRVPPSGCRSRGRTPAGDPPRG